VPQLQEQEPARGIWGIRGLPRILIRDNGALLDRVLSVDRYRRKKWFKEDKLKVLLDMNGEPKPKSSVEYLRAAHWVSTTRFMCLGHCYADLRKHERLIGAEFSLEINILVRYFKYPEIDYPSLQLDRNVVEAALQDHVKAPVALKILGEAIENTVETFQSCWMIWPTIYGHLKRWKDSDFDDRDRAAAILGLFLLTTISQSMAPVQLAALILPEIVEEFEEVRDHGDDNEEQEDQDDDGEEDDEGEEAEISTPPATTHTHVATPTETQEPQTRNSHVKGLPRILTRDRCALLQKVVRVTRKVRKAWFAADFMGSLIAYNGDPKPRSCVEHVQALYAHSLSRMSMIMRLYVEIKRTPEEIERSRCLDWLILRDYFDFPRIDYIRAKLDRELLEATLTDHAHAQTALQLLNAAIERTTDAVLGCWMIWLFIHPDLVQWASLDEDRREAVILGIFVLVTISESVYPIEMARLFAPEIGAEFADMHTVYSARRENPPKVVDELCESQALAESHDADADEDEQGGEPATPSSVERAVDQLLHRDAPAGLSDEERTRWLDRVERSLGEPSLEGPRRRRSRTRYMPTSDVPEVESTVSAAQMHARLQTLVKKHGAIWLEPALPVGKEVWRIPEAGAEGRKQRGDALKRTTALLERLDGLGADDPQRATLQGEIVELVTRGSPIDQQAGNSGPGEGCAGTGQKGGATGAGGACSSTNPGEGPKGPGSAGTNSEERAGTSVSSDASAGEHAEGSGPTGSNAHEQTGTSKSAITGTADRSDPPSASESSGLARDGAALPLAPDLRALPRLPPTERGLSPAVAATAFLQSAAGEEYAGRQADLMWALAGDGQLLSAYWCAQSWATDAGWRDLPAAQLCKAAALAPFVFDDSCAAAVAYQDVLLELTFADAQALFEQRRAPGLYALGLAASLQASLFFSASGAAWILRISNHGLPPELSRLLHTIAALSEQAIQCTLGDFVPDQSGVTEDSRYRQDRVRPIVEGMVAQLPVALDYLQRATQAAITLEDEAGCRVATVALEALNATLAGSKRTPWDSRDLDEWLRLPRLLADEHAGREGAPSVAQSIAQAIASGPDHVSYAAVARQALTTGNLPRARALLFELERTHSEEPCTQDLRSFVDERRRLARNRGDREQTLRSQLSEALGARWITPQDHQTYLAQLDKLAARREDGDYAAQLAELSSIGRALEGHRRARLSELRESAPSELHHHRIIRTSLSPLTVGDERRMAVSDPPRGRVIDEVDGAEGGGSEQRATLTPSVSLVFGLPASGIDQLAKALESLPPSGREGTGNGRSRVVSIDKVRSLHALRQRTRELALDKAEPLTLLIDMPAPVDDPTLQWEICEYVYRLSLRSWRGSLRVVLTLGPAATWQWLTTGGAVRETPLVTLPLVPWTPGALRALLSELSLPAGATHVDLLRRLTGGWQMFLQPLVRTVHSSPGLNGSNTFNLEAALARDRESLACLDADGARRALRAFGLFDVPHLYAIGAKLVSEQLHTGFDSELLSLVLEEYPACREIAADVLVEWGLRLRVLSADPETGLLHLDPTVATLIERAAMPSNGHEALAAPSGVVMPRTSWCELLVDRLPNSIVAPRLFSGERPVRLDGEPHTIGPRIAEACVLFCQAIQRNQEAAVFSTRPDRIDVLGVLIGLYSAWHAALSGHCVPGSWGTRGELETERDIWVLSSGVSWLRRALVTRLKMGNRPLTDKMSCAWYAHRGGKPTIARVGEAHLPSVYLFGPDAVLKGTLATLLEGAARPFAVLVDGVSLGESRELARLIQRLRHLSSGAPILMLGSVGDEVAIKEARHSQMPVWVLRAGDAARLNQLSAERGLETSSLVSARFGGADLASSRVTQSVKVEPEVLEAPATRRWISPLLEAVHGLEQVASDQKEVVSQAYNLVWALLQLCVPWQSHVDAVAASPGVGRFAPLSLGMRLQSLRESPTATGDAMEALQCVVQRAEAAIESLRSPHAVTGKQAALLAAATAAQTEGQPLCIVCSNRATQRAIQAWLGDHNIDVIKGPVRVMSRSQLRRAVVEGTQLPSSTFLVVDPLGFGTGLYVSGVATTVWMILYDFEREAVERKLKYLGRDIHGTSVPHGDKRAWIVDAHGVGARRSVTADEKVVSVTESEPVTARWIPQDTDVDESEPRWRVQWSVEAEEAVLPTQPVDAKAERWVLPPGGWFQAAMERMAEIAADASDEAFDGDDDETAQESDSPVSIEVISRAPNGTPASGNTRVIITLDDGEPPAQLAPSSHILLLRNSRERRGRGAGPEDVERTGESILLASEARVGTLVLILRRASGGGLMKRLRERCNLSADYATAEPLQQMYEDAIALLVQITDGSAAEAYRLLAKHGVPVTVAQTVHRWMQGLVVGPRDAESIRAVGLATGRTELIRHFPLIHAAQTYLRSCNIVLARWIEDIFFRAAGGPDTLVDEQFGLTRADLDDLTRRGWITDITVVNPREVACPSLSLKKSA